MSSAFGTRGNSRLTEVQMFLRADSAEGLVRLQLLNNIKYSSRFFYTDFAQSPIDKKWYCWFQIDMELIQPNRVGNEQ